MSKPNSPAEEPKGWFLAQYGPAIARWGFVAVPVALLLHRRQLEITTEELELLLYLLMHRHRSPEGPRMRLCVLAQQIGIHVRTARAIAARLEQKGLLRRTIGPGGTIAYDLSGLERRLEQVCDASAGGRPSEVAAPPSFGEENSRVRRAEGKNPCEPVPPGGQKQPPTGEQTAKFFRPTHPGGKNSSLQQAPNGQKDPPKAEEFLPQENRSKNRLREEDRQSTTALSSPLSKEGEEEQAVSEGLSALPPMACKALQILRTLPGWPADSEGDTAMMAVMAERFPQLDLVLEAEKFRLRALHASQPLRLPHLAFVHWLEAARRYMEGQSDPRAGARAGRLEEKVGGLTRLSAYAGPVRPAAAPARPQREEEAPLSVPPRQMLQEALARRRAAQPHPTGLSPEEKGAAPAPSNGAEETPPR